MNRYFYLLKNSAVLLILLVYSTAMVKAQSSLYTFTQVNVAGAYQNLSSYSGVTNTGTFQIDTLCNRDSISADIPLGFATGFPYNCKKYGFVRISNNGHLLLAPFGTITPSVSNALVATLTTFCEGVIQPFGTDLVKSTAAGTSSSITYGKLGSDFIVQYKDMARTSSPGDIINFQVWLNGSGQIKFIYGNCTPDPTNSSISGPFVGLRSNHFTDGHWRRVLSGSNWDVSSYSAANGNARFTSVSPAAAPQPNLVYTFNPRNCVSPAYKLAPACINFENNWIDTFGMRPDSFWTTWPGRGNGAWAREDAPAASNNWANGTSGLFSPNGANGTSHSARFHTTVTPIGVYGDLDYYVNFSSCATAAKELSFYYVNTSGGDSLNVYLSTTGSAGAFTKLALNGASTKLTTNSGWTLYTIPLGVISSATCVVRFRAYADNGNITSGTDIGLDEVCVGIPNTPPLVVTLPIGGTAICALGQGISGATLLGTGASTYTWSPALGLSATTGASVIASPTATTVYTVTGTDANCNTATSSISVMLSPKYDLSLITSANYVCANGTATITANDTIYGPSNMPVTYCPGPIPSNGSGSFCITNVNFGAINNTTSGTCLSPSYTDYSSTLSTNVYAGGTYAFTGTMATGSGSMAIWVDYNRNGIFETTEFTSVVTNSGAGNPYTQNITIPSAAQPGLTRMRVRTRVTATGITPSDACTQFSSGGETEDYAVRIIKSPSAVLNIAWLPTTYLNSAATPVVIASNVAASTTYTATITDAFGCNTTATVSIGVQALNCGTITANPALACIGGTSILKSNVTGGGQPYTYLWTGPNIANNATITIGINDSVVVTPNGATVYTLQVTDACGNSCTRTYNLNVFAPPVVSVANAIGGAVQICATNTNNVSMLASGAASYAWSPAPTFLSASGDSANTFVTATTSYVVTGTDVNSCTSATTVIVLYQPNYALTTTATPQYLCAGGTSMLHVSDTVYGSNTAPTSYCTNNLHTTAGSCIDSVIFNTLNNYTSTCALPSYSASLATYQTNVCVGSIYSLKVSLNPFGYASAWIDFNQDGIFDNGEYFPIVINSNTATTTVFIPNTAAVGLTRLRIRSRSSSINANDACINFVDGETEDYLIRIFKTAPAPLVSFNWTPTGLLATNNGNPVVTNAVNTTTPFLVTTTDANGCTKQTGVFVYVQPLVCTAINSSLGTTICSGKQTTLTANYTGGGPNYSFSWATSAGNVGNTASINVSPSTTTTYTVTITNGCTPSASCTQTITINVNTSPSIGLNTVPINTLLCGIGTVTMTANGAIAYSWSSSSLPTFLNQTTGATVIATPMVTATYTVVGTDINGCTASNTKLIVFTPVNSVQAIADPSGIGLCNSTANMNVNDTVTGPQIVIGTYCNNSAATMTSLSDITAINFGNLSNTSTCTTTGAGASLLNKYSDYSAVVPAQDVYTGTIQNFNITVSDCGGVSSGAFIKIFIDYNRNGQFTDPGEEAYVSSAAQAGTFTENGSIYVPTYASAGVVKMRVIVSNTTNVVSILPCGNYTNGETEDYLINIKTTPAYTYSYVWNPGALPGNNVLVSPSATTTYTVTATNVYGCSTASTVTVTVGGVACNAITTNSTTICQGAPATLTANPILGTPPYTYLWSNGDTTKNTTVIPSTTTTYTVIAKDACNATCSKTITINVITAPTLSISQSLPAGQGICVSGTNILTASSNGSSPVYSWSPATFLNTTTSASVIQSNPTTNQIYTVTVTTSVGCTNAVTFNALFSPSYSISVSSNPTTICPNGSTTLIASDTVNGPAISPTYSTASLHTSTGPCIIEVAIANTYTNNTAFTCPIPAYTAPTNAPVATFYTGTSVPLSVTTSVNSSPTLNCVVSAWIDYNRNGVYDSIEWVQISTASIGNLPNLISLNIPSFASPGYTRMRIRTRLGSGNGPTNATTTFASGETEDYLINIIRTSSVIPLSTFVWSGSSGGLGSGNPKIVNAISSNSTYTVTATNAYGCTASNTVGVSVQVLSANAITGNNINCEFSFDTLVAHPRFGGAPYTYAWTSGNANSLVTTYDSVAVIHLSASTIYTVTITDACNSTVTNTISINFVPNQLFFVYASGQQGVCGTGTVNLVTVGNMASFAWSPSTFLSNTTGSFANCINPTATTTYSVLGTDSFGCKYNSNFTVLYSDAIAVSAISNPAAICSGQSATLEIIDTLYGPATMPTNYCGSSANSAVGEDILNVVLGTVNNPSDCITPGPGPGSVLGKYANYTVLAPQDVYSNDSLAFSILLGSCNNSTLANGVKILIDFNRDGDFIDAGELTYTSPTALNGTHTESGFIHVPNVVSPGYTIVRIIMYQTGNPSVISPCGTYVQGETEEYIINLINTPTYVGTSYTWSNGTAPSVGAMVSVSPSTTSTYTVTMSNAAGCTATTGVTVTVGPLNPGIITQSAGNVLCISGFDTLTAHPTGGGAPYHYLWNTGDTTQSIAIVIPAVITYTCTITDACGNTSSTIAVINSPFPPSISINALPTNASICLTGTVNLTAVCTTCASVKWINTNQTSASIAANPVVSAIYTVIGTDGLGCENTATIQVNKSFPHTLNVTNSPLAVCLGSSTVLNTMDSTIGSSFDPAPTNYCIPAHSSSSPCIGTVSFSDLNSVTAGNCTLPSYTYYANKIANVLAGSTVAINVKTAVAGIGANASISVWLDFNKDGLFSTSEYQSIAASVAPNVFATANITIPANAASGYTVMRIRAKSTGSAISANDACTTFSTGETEDYVINIYNTIASTNMSYAWSPSALFTNNTGNPITTNSLSSSSAFTVVATDAFGCSFSAVSTVTLNPPISISVDTFKAVCYGVPSGKMHVNALGGTPPYTYSYHPSATSPIGHPDSAINLLAGTYTVTVQDNAGCSATTLVYITQNPAMVVAVNQVNTACHGTNNGNAYATVTGGVPPYTYFWLDSAGNSLLGNNDSVNNLTTGTYSVYVNDAIGCFASPSPFISFIITEPTAVSVSANATNASCNGGLGSITASASGGTAPINILINGVATNATYTAGTYTVLASDAHACTKSTVVSITQPSALVITTTIANVTCFGGANGNITVNASGGTGATTFLMINNPVLSAYTAGIYTLMATDANNCTVTSTVTIGQPNPVPVVANISATNSCNGDVITLFGSGAATYSWSGGVVDNTPFALTANGFYTVTGQDAIGCTNTSSIFVPASALSGVLALSFNNNDSSLAGNGCKNMYQLDGASLSYYDANCNLIADITDASSGSVLGNVAACVAVSAAVQMHNTQPYVARTYTITPTNQGAAVVTLYFTNDDMMDYNEFVTNSNSAFPQFNYNAAQPNNAAVISNACITKLTNGGIGVGTVDSVFVVNLIYDSTMARWSCTFAINDFSTFYLHTINPNLTPLNVGLASFAATKFGFTTQLKWETFTEKNNDYFAIQRSKKPNDNFVTFDKVLSKAADGNSNQLLTYYGIDNEPFLGMNYYRLLQVDKDKNVTFSNTEKVYFDNNNIIVVYPNPAINTLKIDIVAKEQEDVHVQITDGTGKIVKRIESTIFIGNNTISVDLADLAIGVYQVKINTENGTNYSTEFVKK
jgi:hypothetical protein